MSEFRINNVPPQVLAALNNERERRGKSMDETAVEILASALGVQLPGHKSNGIAKLAGGWTEKELAEFEAAIALTEQIDAEAFSSDDGQWSIPAGFGFLRNASAEELADFDQCIAEPVNLSRREPTKECGQ